MEYQDFTTYTEVDPNGRIDEMTTLATDESVGAYGIIYLGLKKSLEIKIIQKGGQK